MLSLLKRITVREFTPNVIEPSFGLGRILYTLLEHSFWIRAPTKDGERAERGVRAPSLSMCASLTSSAQVLSLPPLVAPTKVLIVPLSAKEEFDPLVAEVCAYNDPSFFALPYFLAPYLSLSFPQPPSSAKRAYSPVSTTLTRPSASATRATTSSAHPTASHSTSRPCRSAR